MPRSILRGPILTLMLCAPVFASGATGLWIDIPFVQQHKDGCGAAAIAMVMQYWQRQQGLAANRNAEYAHISQALLSPPAHGIYASFMERYLQRNGYRTFAFAGQRADLEHNLAKGRPLIAALKPGAGSPLHYVVVAGLDPDQHIVLLNDPAQRKLLKEDDSQFEKEWKAAGNWTLLAVPATAAP
jgi:ABC-type bacteriocin/lantibiotic exporter with double-glycine peptidase domain